MDLQNRCKTSRTSLKVRAKKSRRNFSQRTHLMVRNTPKHEFRVQWGGSGAFVAKCSCHEVALEFFAMNKPDSPHWTLNSCFGSFCTVCVHLGPLSCLTKLGAKCSELVKSSSHEVASNHFATNATDPPHWTLNSCFGAFRTILVHWEPFGCFMKLGAKRAEQV